MHSRFIVVLLFIFCFYGAIAQNSSDIWTLERSVQYALAHNISIKQSELNARLGKYTLLQSQLAQLPSANASTSYGRSYGRSINPTTNQFEQGSYDFLSLSGNANVLLFGWFQQRNIIAGNRSSLEASKADLDQLKDDVSLNVATGYLRAILALEQIHISERQVALSKAQLEQTQAFAEAGRLPELNVAQLESQLATDSANLITAITNYNASIIDIKTILNLDFEAPFNVVAPDVKVADQIQVSGMRPEEVYQEAHKHFGSIRGNIFRVDAARKNLAARKGGLYPQLSFGAQFGSNWANNFLEVVGYNITGAQPSGGFIPVGDTVINVYQPTFDYQTRAIPFGRQIDNNFRQTYALTLTIPLFNGWTSQYAVRQARINLSNQQLTTDQAELTLRQNVYKAHNDATNSIQKYYAAQRAADAAQRALEFAKKRHELGLISTVDFLVTQNSQYAAASNLLSAKYDLIFKLKVIDYYLGKELKL